MFLVILLALRYLSHIGLVAELWLLLYMYFACWHVFIQTTDYLLTQRTKRSKNCSVL